MAFVLVGLAVAIGVVWHLAASYQPLAFGGASGTSLAGMPSPAGTRFVNDFGGEDGQTYVPPQLRPFTISESIANEGSRSVTILAVSLTGPNPVEVIKTAGPSRWTPEFGGPYATSRPIAGLTLHPHQYVDVGMLVRTATACYEPGGWTRLDNFWVKERFMSFTRWVRLPLGTPVLMHEPLSTAEGGVCA